MFVKHEDIIDQIKQYVDLPCTFTDFIDMPNLKDEEIELLCVNKAPAIPEKKYVPSYFFNITKDGEIVGEINLRIGYTEALYYGGNIGYGINEPYRGNSYAAKACKLLIPLMQAHDMTTVTISNEKDNIASKRTCEKAGTTFLYVAELPEWTELYMEGQRYVNIFKWIF